jgi:hypothetical protein
MRPHVRSGRQWARRHRSRLVACATTLMLAAGLAGYAISGAAAGTGPSGIAAHSATGAGGADAYNAATGTTEQAQQQPPPQTDVTLITGDRAELSTAPDGQQAVNPVPTAGQGGVRGSSGFVRFGWAGDEYLVPDDAVAYLASGVLDPRLFDVSYLARAGFGGQLPVQLSYTGQAVPSLPGLHITHAAAGTATGTLASAQALRFGALLAGRQATALASHATPGLLPGISRISLAPAGSAAPAPAMPAVPAQLAAPAAGASGGGPAYYTLTLKFIAPDGAAGTAIGMLQDLTDPNLIPGDQQAYPSGEPGIMIGTGTYRISVPAGTYSAEFSIITSHSGTYIGYDAALVVKPQFSVNSDTTVTLDARTAVPYHVTLDGITAPPVQTDELDFERTAENGLVTAPGLFETFEMGLVSVSGDGFTGSDLSVSPTASVSAGALGFQATTWLGAKKFNGAEPNSTYLFHFPSQGRIPSSLSYTVRRQELTAYHENLYANPLGTCGNNSIASIWIYQPAVGIGADALTEWQYQFPPGDSRTDYWYDSDPRLDQWQPTLAPADCNPAGGWSIVLDDAPSQIRPGGQVTATWNKAPLTAPSSAALHVNSPFLVGGSAAVTQCTACRQGDGAFVTIYPFSDSDPATYNDLGNGPGGASAVTFYRNGQLAINPGCSFSLTGQPVGCALTPWDLDLPLLPQAASYRLDWSYQDWVYSTAATTTMDWTFRSAPGAGGVLPGHEICPPIASQGCTYLPLLFIGYDLALNDAGQAVAGRPFPVTFTVTHQQGEAPPSGVSATVSASFDNGKTWTAPQAAASLGAGRFTATIQQPPLAKTDGFVSLRVIARDSAGNAVTQTLIEAYGLTG